MPISSLTQTSLTQTSIVEKMGPQIDAVSNEMTTLLDSMKGSEISSQELLQTQAKLQQLQTITGLQSQLVKSLGDLFKEILQKTS